MKHRTDPKPEYIRIQQAYIDGAKFGYNKANEWQYVSEKGIPKVKGNYHVWLGKYNYALTYFDETKLWIVSDDPVDGWIDLKDVIAWKEIVFPELKESE